eukprot:TRINITY_DN2251_c1_g1_i11.p1 TRINITY_DN2251_c1_g1~~TRINITY_DN2251_c1_g1_i11.p1  ORF type:complete len:100 (+),score=21.39 TRINITY_DN2251_c1_g1_i11:643-942(+)
MLLHISKETTLKLQLSIKKNIKSVYQPTFIFKTTSFTTEKTHTALSCQTNNTFTKSPTAPIALPINPKLKCPFCSEQQSKTHIPFQGHHTSQKMHQINL